jgi:hypothetical protein
VAAKAYRIAADVALRTGDEARLATANDKIGHVLFAKGDHDGAVKAYQVALSILEVRAGRDPSDGQRQRDLSISRDNIGDVLLAKDYHEGALKVYRGALATSETLAQLDPGNPQRQRDLSIGHSNVSDVLLTKDDHDGALVEYKADLCRRLPVRPSETVPGSKNTSVMVFDQRDTKAGSSSAGDTRHRRAQEERARAPLSRRLRSIPGRRACPALSTFHDVKCKQKIPTTI